MNKMFFLFALLLGSSHAIDSDPSRIFIAGHKGMVGSAIIRKLTADPKYKGCQILTVDRKECDLTRQEEVEQWFEKNKPDYVFLAAAKVGGIWANMTYPAQFIYDNLMIEANVIQSAYKSGVKKLLFLGSSCIYPKFAPQPIEEKSLLEGALEPTNEAYALAKICGIKLCQAYKQQFGCRFISAMPTNLYGPNDNFDLNNSHVLPALIRKMHEAKANNQETVELWGTGTPKREFLHVDDLADACVLLMEKYEEGEPINVGTGEDLKIQELAHLVSQSVGFKGEITFNPSKPDGTPRKCLNIEKLKSLGWSPQISLKDGIETTYQWYLSQLKN